jgi:1-acyl-sn-glycerol-3-phosphate acyltransferase
VTLASFGSRKALAAHCHRVIAEGVSAALAGRLPAETPPARPAQVPAPTADPVAAP